MAVAKAKQAFFGQEIGKNGQYGQSGWGYTSGSERAAYLRKIADVVQENSEWLAALECRDNGKPLREAQWDIDDVAGCFRYYAEEAEKLGPNKQNEITKSPIALPDDRFESFTTQSPIGVAALITPWNYPLLMAAWKIAPALAAGCTCILKPASETPLTALEFTGLIHEKVGLPAGVFNCLLGPGSLIGEALCMHPDVDKIAFTGSCEVGRKVGEYSLKSPILKNVSLELGGKSPIVVFPGVDIVEAVEWAMFGVFWTNGQICSSTSRLIIHESMYEPVMKRLVEETKKIYVGDPFTDRNPSIGPLVSKKQQQLVLSYIESARQEGAKVVVGGSKGVGLDGFYVEPTVIVDVTPQMRVWKEEIFGPVLVVATFKTEAEAVRLANDTEFGLGAAILCQEQAVCDRFVQAFRAGIIWINCSQPAFVQCPWGGFRNSGNGTRDIGLWGLKNFLETKQVTKYLVKEPGKWGWFIKEGQPAKL